MSVKTHVPTSLLKRRISNHTFYVTLLLVLQWVAIFLLSFSKPLYTIVFVPLLIVVFLYLSRKSKLLLALCCVSLYLGYVALFQELPKTIRDTKCFEFNVSYPGTKEYTRCVNSLTQADYTAEIFKP